MECFLTEEEALEYYRKSVMESIATMEDYRDETSKLINDKIKNLMKLVN